AGAAAQGGMAGILAWFWNERFWLPHNVTWADLKNTEEATLPQVEDLYLVFPLAFCIFMIRILFESCICGVLSLPPIYTSPPIYIPVYIIIYIGSDIYT
uniref:Uncharacterized protein n=1 Tax=Naja naja TaxID=35670 RepID=A0A8C6X145_NAJNA